MKYNILAILFAFVMLVSGCQVENISNAEAVRVDDVNEVISASSNLTESDAIFLEDHVYGSWQITRRIAMLDETGLDFEKSTTVIKNITYGTSNDSSEPIYGIFTDTFFSIFSDETIITAYYYPLGDTPVYFDATDLYLFGLYGGFNSDVINPVYKIVTMDAKNAELNDIMCYGEQNLINLESIFNVKSVKRVTYALEEDAKSFVERRNFGDILYIIDENDYDTLYIDFCGLWEMKRVIPDEEIPNSHKSRGLRG